MKHLKKLLIGSSAALVLFFNVSAFAQLCYDPEEGVYYSCYTPNVHYSSGYDDDYYDDGGGVGFGFVLPFGYGGGYHGGHGGGYHGGHGGGFHGGGHHH